MVKAYIRKGTPSIHPTAVIEEGAKIGENVTIEPYAIIKENVTLGNGVVVKSHAYIDGYTEIGENTVVWPYASIGTQTQDLKYQGERTFVRIGKNCQIREFVTINSSCGEDSQVLVGDNCLIMAYCHIAHNCEVGNHVIMSNNATLAGHVIVEDNAIIGGLAAIHQFCRVGTYAMVGGMSRVTHDVPPYTIGGGVPYKLGGINSVGLKRNDFPFEVRCSLSKAFKIIYRNNLTIQEALLQMEKELGDVQEVRHMIHFIKGTERGLIGFHCKTKQAEG